MEGFMVWVGAAIVIATFWLIYKNYEPRLVLFLSGLVMLILGQYIVGSKIDITTGMTAFVKTLVNGGLVPTFTTVMGFGYVMSYTKCSDHMVNAMVRPLTKVPAIVIPGAVIITWICNIFLPSAVGVAASVGVLLIPALVALGVNPIMACAAVFLGTWGSAVSPGLMFNPQVADIAYRAGEISSPDAMIVIMAEFVPALIAAVCAALILAVLAKVLKEGVGTTKITETKAAEMKNFKINYLYALVPILPLALLVLASKQVGLLPTKTFSVPVCMLIGTGVGMLVGLVEKFSPGKCSTQFCKGCGEAFGSIALLMGGAAVFAAGMNSIGLTGELVDLMKASQSAAQIAAAVGPFVMAIVCGSGNAAALAFNEAITPHAHEFGMTIVQLGAVAQMCAGIGRSMSPIAGGVIVLAGIAGVSPMETCKRTALPCVVAAVVFTGVMYIF